MTIKNIQTKQIITVKPTTANYYTFNFNFNKNFIDKNHLEPIQKRQKIKNNLNDLNKPLNNQNLIT